MVSLPCTGPQAPPSDPMTHFPNHQGSQGGGGGNGGARCWGCRSMCRRNLVSPGLGGSGGVGGAPASLSADSRPSCPFQACGMSVRHQVRLGPLVHGMLCESPRWMAARQVWPQDQDRGSGCPCRRWRRRRRRRLGPRQRLCCSATSTVSTGMTPLLAGPQGLSPRQFHDPCP